jgi:hypothetical protein
VPHCRTLNLTAELPLAGNAELDVISNCFMSYSLPCAAEMLG